MGVEDGSRETFRRPSDGPLHPGTGAPSLVALLEMALDPEAWEAFSRGSATRRAGRAGFARNVCVALGSWGAAEALPVLARALGGWVGRLRIDRKPVGHGPPDGDHRGPQACIGSEDPEVAVPMDAGRWNEAGQAVEQLETRSVLALEAD
jgi:hypothetical protein